VTQEDYPVVAGADKAQRRTVANKMEQHPTVQQFRAREAQGHIPPEPYRTLDAAWLWQLCLDAGADDVGFIAIDRPELEVDTVSRAIVTQLETMGIRAVNEPSGFPMEMGRFPEQKPWTISHKPIAVAAGLGQMGIHRNVIHPKFGNTSSSGGRPKGSTRRTI